MLSKHGSMAPKFGRRLLELDRMNWLPVCSCMRVVPFPYDFCGPHLRIVTKVGQRVDWRGDRIQCSQNAQPLLGSTSKEGILEFLGLFIDMSPAFGLSW